MVAHLPNSMQIVHNWSEKGVVLVSFCLFVDVASVYVVTSAQTSVTL